MVIIKDYKMPHNCYDCDLHNYHECDLTCESIEDDYCWNGDSREKHCPLREVETIPKEQYSAIDLIWEEIENIYLEMPDDYNHFQRTQFYREVKRVFDRYRNGDKTNG